MLGASPQCVFTDCGGCIGGKTAKPQVTGTPRLLQRDLARLPGFQVHFDNAVGIR
jgi:hypothetical protein